MKKILFLLALLSLTALSLFSCDGGFEDIFGGGAGDTEVNVDHIIWSPDVTTTLVFDEEFDEISDLRQHLYGTVGLAPETAGADSAVAEHEVVFGDVGREISDTAYRKLDRYADFYSLEQDGESAYLIYAQGGSMAIAYTDTYSRYAAIRYLIDNCTDSVYAADGVVKKSVFNTEEFISAHRDTVREEGFARVEEELGKEAADALRNVYSLYDTDLYYLLANLYDPEIGGFYYSVSARDTYGYLPDIESTAQALNLVDRSGLSSDVLGVKTDSYGTFYWPNYISQEMREQLYSFALSLKAEDGYFYHPQWGTSVSASRKGRDKGWGNRIIAALEGMADGTAFSCDTVVATSYVNNTDKALADRLISSNVQTAVMKALPSSKVISVASTFEESLVSEAEFTGWLDSSLKKNSYSTGNTISANISAIKDAGLHDCLYRYLVDNQCENGLWEEETSFNAINGLMKLCSAFDSDHPFPNPKTAVDSTIQIMTDPDQEIETVCFVYNPWVALKSVIPQCSEADRAEIQAYLRENAATLIYNTFEKLSVFKKDDGGFSMEPECSSKLSQGALAAVADSEESDVNATGIAVSTVVSYMMPVLGVSAPTMYAKFDSIYFLETLDGLEGVIKKVDHSSNIETVTFDDYDPDEGEEANGVVLYPNANVQTNIGNSDIDSEGMYKWLSTSVVANPDPSASVEDLVLRVIDYVYDYDKNGKAEDGKSPAEMAGTGSSVEFMMANSSAVGDCYIYEADMYFNAESASNINDCLGQIIFQTAKANSTHSAWLNIYSYTKGGETYLRLQENWAGPDKVTDGEVVTGIPVNEWFNLRIEIYKSYDGEGKLSMMAKCYLNGEFAGECDGAGYWSTTKLAYEDKIISSVKFSLYRQSTSEWYFNNVTTYKSNTLYEQEDIPAYIKPSDTESYDFESGALQSGDYLNIVNYTKGEDGEDMRNYIDSATAAIYNGGSFLSIAADPKDATNSVLKIFTNSVSGATYTSGITVTPFVKDKNGEVYVLDYDYYLESDANTIATAIANYGIIYGGKAEDGSAQAIYKTLADGAVAFRPGNTTSSSLNLPTGQWIRVRTVMDAGLKTLTTYVSLDGGATWQSYMKSDAVLSSAKISAIELSFSSNEAQNRVQYIDDLSFTLVKELYMTLTNGDEQTYGVPLGIIPSDTKVYDFSTDALVSGKTNVTVYNAMGKTDSLIEAGGTATGTAGSFLSIASDPKDATNKVLKNYVAESGTASFITLNPYVEAEGGKVFVFDFDHYYEAEGDSGWGGIDYLIVNHSDFSTVSSQAVFKPTLKDDNNDGKLEITYRGGNISNADLNVPGQQWIKIRAVIDDENNQMYIYMSSDGGQDWVLCLAKPVAINEADIISMTLQFSGNKAKDRVEYFDNISFVQTNGISFTVNGITQTFGKV